MDASLAAGGKGQLERKENKRAESRVCIIVLASLGQRCQKHRVPRTPRIQYPGAIYHVMSRGDRREDIYLDDVDRHDFLKTLA